MTMLLIGVGVTGVLADSALQRVGREQVETAAQLSEDARLIYESLAKADSFATGYLLKPEPSLWKSHGDERGLITKHLLDAVRLTGGDISRAADVAKIFLWVSVYTELVDKTKRLVDGARRAIASGEKKGGDLVAEKRAIGQAVLGFAYMHEASFYLRTVLLPAVKEFRDHETDNLRGARDAAFRTGGSHLLLLLAGLGGLAWIQWSLARRTHRFLNYGLLGATILIVVMLGVTGWSLRNWSEIKEGLEVIEKGLIEQQRDIDAERAILLASADINLFLAGDSVLNLNDLRVRFKKEIDCANINYKKLCDAYDKLTNDLLVTGENAGATTSELPNGGFWREFSEAGKSKTKEIRGKAGQIEAKAKRLPSAPSRTGAPIVLLCSCAAVCASLGFWIRIKEYL